MAAAEISALGAATCFAVCSVMQHRETGKVALSDDLGAGLLLRLLRQPLFLIAAIVEISGLGLQTVALNLGTLAVVQPLLVLGLLIAVPLGAVLDHRPLSRGELLGALVCVVGLAVFLVAADPTDGISDVRLHRGVPIAMGLGGVTLICLGLSLRSPAQRGIWLGMASGALYGVSSGLIKCVAHLFSDEGLGVVTHWEPYALVAIGGSGLILTQHAFAAGGLGAPLAVLTLAEPVAAVIVGRFVLDEHLAGGVGAPLLQTAGALASAAGVWLVSMQPGARVRLPAAA